MKGLTAVCSVVLISGCATTESLDRNNRFWANTVVGCQSAAELSGTAMDQSVWNYEEQAILRDRNGGWPSDQPRLSNAVKKEKKRLSNAGVAATSGRLEKCHQVVELYFPDGHPAIDTQ